MDLPSSLDGVGLAVTFRLKKQSVPKMADRSLQSFKEAADSGTRSMRGVPFVDGKLSAKVDLGASDATQLRHRLGRVPKGAVVVLVEPADPGGANLDGPVTTSSYTRDTLLLRNHATTQGVTVQLWVF